MTGQADGRGFRERLELWSALPLAAATVGTAYSAPFQLESYLFELPVL